MNADSLFETLLAEQRARRLPPVSEWKPTRRGAIDIRIARDGTWFHEGEMIKRDAMVRLFATILRKEEERFYLVTPVEQLEIVVEDAPMMAIALEVEGEGTAQRVLLSTNGGDHVLVDAGHPIRVEDPMGVPSPYVHVRDGLEARLTRPAFYALVNEASSEDQQGRIGVWSCGLFFPIGEVG